jgi:hypothetical protein
MFGLFQVGGRRPGLFISFWCGWSLDFAWQSEQGEDEHGLCTWWRWIIRGAAAYVLGLWIVEASVSRDQLGRDHMNMAS